MNKPNCTLIKLKKKLTVILIILSFNLAFAQEKPEKASHIFNKAVELAQKENKNIFIMFHASWCGWCKKMDASMNDPSIKDFFTDNYVIEHLVVKESEKNRNLENPGAFAMLKNHGGGDSGIPYWLIFDSYGNLMADSKMVKNDLVLNGKGSNIGCPGTEDEVNSFIYKLKETSNLNDGELALIAKRFRLNNPKPSTH